jgi:hypothetical protein
MQNPRTRTRKSQPRAQGRPRGLPNKPPQQASSIVIGKTLRFQAAGAQADFALTRAGLLDLLVMATSTTAAYRIASASRIRRIDIWGQPPAQQGSVNPIQVEWLSSLGPSKIITDVGMGATFGAKVTCRPPANSLAGFWSLTGSDETEQLVRLTLPPQSVIDLHVTFQLQNNLDAENVPVAVVVAGATIGTVYVLPLDFAASGASAEVSPVSYNSVV